MRASAGGALGAFLMITPLVAIPVFAVVGIPQVAPVVTPAVGDEEPVLAQTAVAKPAAPAIAKPATDNLVATMGTGAAPGIDARSLPSSPQPVNGTAQAFRQPAASNPLPPAKDGVEWIPPADALDGWALAPDKPVKNATPEPAAVGDSELDDLPVVPNRKPRSSASKRKPVRRGFDTPFASVQDDPVAPPARRGNPVRSQPATAPAAAAGEKISLAKFTQGLIHPTTAAAGSSSDFSGDRGITKPAPRSIPGGEARVSAKALDGHGRIEESGNWDAAVQRLNQLKIREFKLDSLPGGERYVFNCSYTPAGSPKTSRRFEAVADEPLLAVQKVLRQIDEWQLQH